VSCHVLVVEDEPSILRGYMRAINRDPGLRATGCAMVEEAVGVLLQDPPDILVTDLNLPGRHGLEMINELEAAGLRIPIIVVTAFKAHYEHSFPERADLLVLEKPISVNHLLSVIHARLGAAPSQGARAGFQVADYLQLAGMSRASVVLRASLEQGDEGWLEIVEGDVWNAYFGSLVGEEAVAALMHLPAAAVATQVLAEPPGARQITRGLEGLLLELARQKDESRRNAPEPAPPATAERVAYAERAGYAERMEAGMAAVRNERWAEAVVAFEAALAARPEDSRARHNLERSRRLLGEAGQGGRG